MNKASAFTEPERLVEPLSWAGHVPFAFWIIETLRPRVYVELGTHTGNSFFACCQSVLAHRLPTRCFAVDTWQGDEHAGFYGDDIYNTVSGWNESHYREFSTLLRITFDEALSQFEAGSIDLLHIDGLHTYEAVRHDFESWLPKMSQRGVVLFHDTVVRHGDFGVWKLWEELSASYPHLSFEHSNGLGVLFTGTAIDPALRGLLDEYQTTMGRSRIKALFSNIGDRLVAVFQEAAVEQGTAPDLPGVAYPLASSFPGKRADRQDGGGASDQRETRLPRPVRKLRKSIRKRYAKLKDALSGGPGSDQTASHQPRNADELYRDWLERYENAEGGWAQRVPKEETGGRTESFGIGLVMLVRRLSLDVVEQAVNSVREQVSSQWRLCLVADSALGPEQIDELERCAAGESRITVVAATGKEERITDLVRLALERLNTPYVAFADPEDTLHPMALFRAAGELRNHPETVILYTDEDALDSKGRRCRPWFKTDFNYELLLSCNYLGGLTVCDKVLVEQVGGLRRGYDGAERYDLMLRMIEKAGFDKVRHLPEVLVHRSVSDRNPKEEANGSRKALREHMQRRGIACTIEPAPELWRCNRVRYLIDVPVPSVEIIILTRDRAPLLASCVDSILARTAYENYSITIVDNGSVEQASLELFKRLQGEPNVRVVRNDAPFNFSCLNNLVVEQSDAEFVCLLNNDIEIINAEWLYEMVAHALQEGAGAVGARLWYPDQTLQHGGVLLGVGGIANHAHLRLPIGWSGYFGRGVLQQSFSAVTGACLVVRKALYREVGGLNEEQLGVAYNDVDFCLKLHQRGYRNLWTPYAELYHHESASRGPDVKGRKMARLNTEADYMKERWGAIIADDPAYNPNLTAEALDFSLAWPPRGRA